MEMHRRAAVVAAMLKELGVPMSIEKMEDRIAMQKAIYLAQVSGADLGYRFNWYVRGPYCPDLARDYYAAMESPDGYASLTAAQCLKDLVAKAKEAIDKKPEDTSLAAWLEAIASLDFLLRIRRVPEAQLRERFVRGKPYLEHLYETALESIRTLVKSEPAIR